jgi:type IV pilus assembly protein PilA
MMKRLQKKGFTLIELMIVVAIIGILAAIAIPNFIRFQARSKQGEAKSNLKALFTAQRSFYQEKDRYVDNVRDIGFSPERGNRYRYLNGDCTNAEDRSVMPATTHTDDECITVDTAKHTSATTDPGFIGAAPSWKKATGQSDPGFPGASGTCPVCEFSGQAVGNIDNELTGLDSWYISSVDSLATFVCPAGTENVPAGGPSNLLNDVNCDTNK